MAADRVEPCSVPAAVAGAVVIFVDNGLPWCNRYTVPREKSSAGLLRRRGIVAHRPAMRNKEGTGYSLFTA